MTHNLRGRAPLAPLPIIGYRKNGCPIYPVAGGARSGNPVLKRLVEQRDAAIESMDTLLNAVEEQERSLSDVEKNQLEATRATIADLDSQIKPLEEFEKLAGEDRSAARAYGGSGGGDEDRGGERRSAGHSQPRGHEYKSRGEVIVDMLLAHSSSRSAKSASGLVRLDESQTRAAHARLQSIGVPYDGAPERYLEDAEARAVAHEKTTQLTGILPTPIVGEVDNDLDAARPFVQSVGARQLGGIPGKVFSRPTITQHTTSGKQSAEKAELPSRQFIVDGVDFTKETHGGSLNVSRQSIDWTSPAAWDALLTDLQEEYGIDTETVATEAFAAAITQATPAVVANDLEGWATGLYEAAALAYKGGGRLPTHIWVSLDMWVKMGAIVDTARRVFGGSDGSQQVSTFAGNIFDLPRTVVPTFPAETVIVGVTKRTEFYEERIGLLQAVQPSVLGIEIAYGGNVAFGTIRPNAFAKVTPPVVTP